MTPLVFGSRFRDRRWPNTETGSLNALPTNSSCTNRMARTVCPRPLSPLSPASEPEWNAPTDFGDLSRNRLDRQRIGHSYERRNTDDRSLIGRSVGEVSGAPVSRLHHPGHRVGRRRSHHPRPSVPQPSADDIVLGRPALAARQRRRRDRRVRAADRGCDRDGRDVGAARGGPRTASQRGLPGAEYEAYRAAVLLICEIDKGLRNSRVGIVLVATALLKSIESEGVAEKELAVLLSTRRVVPVLHGVSFDDLNNVSPAAGFACWAEYQGVDTGQRRSQDLRCCGCAPRRVDRPATSVARR